MIVLTPVFKVHHIVRAATLRCTITTRKAFRRWWLRRLLAKNAHTFNNREVLTEQTVRQRENYLLNFQRNDHRMMMCAQDRVPVVYETTLWVCPMSLLCGIAEWLLVHNSGCFLILAWQIQWQWVEFSIFGCFWRCCTQGGPLLIFFIGKAMWRS